MADSAGELLRAVRRAQQMKQSVLARKVGTAQSVISDYERGERSPSVEYLGRLLNALDHELVLEARPRTDPDGESSGR